MLAAGQAVTQPHKGPFDTAIAGLVVAVGCLAMRAMAHTPATLSGPTVQVQPYAPEPGVPLITVYPGTPNPSLVGTDPSGSGAGATNGARTTGTAGSVALAGLSNSGASVGSSAPVPAASLP